MRRWNDHNLGVVSTIYEEEEEHEDLTPNSKPHSLSASFSSPIPPASSSVSPPSSLQACIDEWTRATGLKPNVVIRVKDQFFNLHKEPLASRSRYFHQRLTNSSDDNPLAISIPSSISVDTLASVAAFCYGAEIVLSPSNVAAFHVAAESLQMDPNFTADTDHDNLLDHTDRYFCQAIATSVGCATLMLRTCIDLISTAGDTAAFLAGRCLEALAADSGEKKTWVTTLAVLKVDEFHMIATAMRARLVENHDFVYEMVERYLQCRASELSEEEKNLICSAVDCKRLTHPRLVDLVQNHRMPLRFVVQAMLIEQFRTHTTVINGISRAATEAPVLPCPMTLGDILRREAVLRQVENLRSTMAATSFRIRSLEEELASLRRRLKDEERFDVGSEQCRVRTASFRFYKESEEGDECESVKEVKGRRGLGRAMVSGIVRLLRLRLRVDVGSLSCRRDGDVLRVEEIRELQRGYETSEV